MERRPRWTATWRRATALALGATCALSVLPLQPSAADSGVTVSGGGTFGYVEQEDPIAIGTGLSITDGITYAGEHVEFAVTDATAHDLLSLATTSTPVVDDGIVSVVGTTVYLGNGTEAEPIGSVDPVLDGQGGRALRVSFSAEFTNPGFETGDGLGWTAIEDRVELGVTEIAGFPTVDTASYPADAGGDHYVPSQATYSVRTTQSGNPTEGQYALELASTNMSVTRCGVVHGPAVYSSEFQAAAGDKIYFDWRAFAGGDAYAVFGYIVDRDGNQTEVLDAWTNDEYGTTEWATKETVIPTAGWYRFVFVAGTYDATCGTVAGARLLIDNVRVFGTKVTDDVAGQVARLLQYANTSDDPAPSREVVVTAKSNERGTGSGTVTVEITPVDDPPTLADPTWVQLVNSMAADEVSPVTGRLLVTDPDDDAFTFDADGAEARPTTIDEVAYTHAVDGTYGTLHLHAETGDWAFVPHADALDARLTPDRETFPISVTASGATATATLTVDLSIAASAPSAPTAPVATPGDGEATLTWDAPWWTADEDVTYEVELSADGETWTTVATDVEDLIATIGELANGTAHQLRVRAVNQWGASKPSEAVTVTPHTTPGAPVVTSLTAGNRQLTVAFAAPADDGGSPVTGYQVSVDNGTTWSSTHDITDAVTVYGLTNGTTYPVRVRAVNAGGPGAPSDALAGTPTAAPVAPPADADDEVPGPGVPAGGVKVLVNGEEVTATVRQEADGTWVLEGDGWSVSLVGLKGDGTSMPVDAEGRLIVEAGGFVRVAGTGFLPGSSVDVWIMSTPVHLGDMAVGADGSFDERLALPAGIAPGPHTVQLNGLSALGENRSASVGIVVLAQPEPEDPADPADEDPAEAPTTSTTAPATGGGALPRTGGDAGPTAGWATLLAALGAAKVAAARRLRIGAER